MSEKVKYRATIEQVDDVYKYHIFIQYQESKIVGWNYITDDYWDNQKKKFNQSDWYFWAWVLARTELRKCKKNKAGKGRDKKKKFKTVGG